MASGPLIPLESNPEVMTKFLQKIGVPCHWNIVDVMSLEPELLLYVPRPVLAVILLFPITNAYEEQKVSEESKILSHGQEVSENLFYIKQNISNSCGTVALIHAVANNMDMIGLNNGPLKTFLAEAKSLDPIARGTLLEQSEGIINAHKELALEGQTNAPNANDPVNHHFVTFVQMDGFLYELDGNKAFPINHGPTRADKMLRDAAKLCKDFMARNPEEIRFTVVALSAVGD